jgi:hypothetical protein
VVESPCINVCELEDNDVCTGCFRNLKEIGSWLLVSDLQRERVLRLAKARQKLAGQSLTQ